MVGNAIFVFLLTHFGLRAAYLLLRFVTIYFIPFAPRATRSLYSFYRKRMGFGVVKSWIGIYRNYNQIGEAIIDKVALLSGVVTDFSFAVEGDEHLDTAVKGKKGVLLLSGHMGNWEIAGQMLSTLSHALPVTVLLYQVDHDRVQSFMDKNGAEARSFSIIPVKDGTMDHIFPMSQKLSEGGAVCFHIDRYFPGSKTVIASLLDAPVKLPAGPYLLAAQFDVPILFVFAVKTGYKKYRVILSEPTVIKRIRDKEKQEQEVQNGAADFSNRLENIIKEYPYQWFNYYDFWKESK
ncbi:hypothetical protein KAH37_10315 [bacterium]|nr:hypothetical protein [bacterium]